MLADTELTAGDFVRWVRQVTDFAGQIADAAGPGELRETARTLVRSMRRGVVTYSADDELPTTGDDAADVAAPSLARPACGATVCRAQLRAAERGEPDIQTPGLTVDMLKSGDADRGHHGPVEVVVPLPAEGELGWRRPR